MVFQVRSATIKEKQVIFDLLQPYLEELSHFPGEEIDCKGEDGVYHYSYLDAYWRESERFPYLLLCDDVIAGFALVRQERDHWEMAEYYVLPEFRRCGLAMACATEIFRKHQGKWRIDFNKHNQIGRTFWLKLAQLGSKSNILTHELNASHDNVSFLC